MPAQPPTNRSTPRLSEQARHVVVPKGAVTTGWPAVCKKCADLGLTFRPWQDGAGRIILAKRDDGTYASTIGGTGMSIPRQVGKTFLVGAIIFALCILIPNLTVIWTAHRLRTAEETFGKMQVFAKRRLIKPHVLKTILGSGEEEIKFHNGSRILFGARERGFGRGFDEVDVLVFDEAQILTEAALDDMIPATNQSRQSTGALLLFLGTPPKPTDRGDVFTRMRTECLTGEDDDTGWIEFGADPDFVPTPAPAPLTAADWEQVAKANPSFPEDTPRPAILRMRKKLGPDSFLREGLGIWDGSNKPLGKWAKCLDPDSTIAGRVAVSIDVRPDMSSALLAVAGRRADGISHAELVPWQRGAQEPVGPGTAWVLDRAIEVYDSNDACCLVIDPATAAGAFEKELLERGFMKVPVGEPVPAGKRRLHLLTAREHAQACGSLAKDVNELQFRHPDQQQLADSADGVRKKAVAGAFKWDPGDSEAEIGPVVAVTNARHGFAMYGLDEPAFFAAWR